MTAKEQSAEPPGRSRIKRQVYRLLLIIPITYLAVCLLVFLFQARIVYFPSRHVEIKPGDLGMAFEEVTLKTSDDVSIAGWYVPHDKPRGTVLFCHGNAGNIAGRLVDIQILHQMGYSVFIFDYRGFGASQGRPTEQGTYLDAEASWRYLLDVRRESPDRVVVFGRSLGGAVAIELASRHTPGALVVESTFTSLADVGRHLYPLLPVGLLCRFQYDSVKKVGDIPCPKLFLHGNEDRLIPITIGRALFDAACEPKQFIETPGGHGNGGFTFSTATTEQAAAFLRAALPPPSSDDDDGHSENDGNGE